MSLKRPIFLCGLCYDDKIFSSDMYINSLYKIDINTGDILDKFKFPNEELYSDYNHYFCKKYDDEIWYFPYLGKNISVYNVKTNEITTIKIDSKKYKEEEFVSRWISYCFKQGNFIYAYPVIWDEGFVLKINLKEKKIVEYKKIFLEKYKPSEKKSNRDAYLNDQVATFMMCELNDKFIFPLQGYDKIACIYKENPYKIEVINIESPYPVSNIFNLNDKLYLTFSNNLSIAILDKKSLKITDTFKFKSYEKLNSPLFSFERNQSYFFKYTYGFVHEGEEYFLSGFYNGIFKINKKLGEIEQVLSFNRNLKYNPELGAYDFDFGYYNNKKIYIYSSLCSGIIVYDFESKKESLIEIEKLKDYEEEIKNKMKILIKEYGKLDENILFQNPKDMLDLIEKKVISENLKENIGEKIYKKLK